MPDVGVNVHGGLCDGQRNGAIRLQMKNANGRQRRQGVEQPPCVVDFHLHHMLKGRLREAQIGCERRQTRTGVVNLGAPALEPLLLLLIRKFVNVVV